MTRSAPLVFHIGWYKTGTTWLQAGLFDTHPDIELISNWIWVKGDPFLRYVITARTGEFDPVEARSLLPRTSAGSGGIDIYSAERITGHPYSGGFDSFTIAGRLAEVAPDARVIVTVRDQGDLVLSMWKQLVTEGYPGTFDDFIGSEGFDAPAFDLDWLAFDRLVDRYDSLFGHDNVLVLRFEDLATDPDRYLEDLCSFLEVAPMRSADLPPPTNISWPMQRIRAQRWLNHFRRSEFNRFPLPWLGARPTLALARITAPIWSRKQAASDAQLAAIRNQFVDSNARLSHRIAEQHRAE